MKKHYFGISSIKNLNKILVHENPNKIFLVTGKKSYKTSGAQDKLRKIIKNYRLLRFWEFQLNPKIEDINKGVSLYKKFKPDFVVAIGGGSTIDMAKSINILSNQPHQPKEYVSNKRKIQNPGRKLVAIPTTAGSGSETTHFATLYIDKTKHSLAHQYVLPNYSIVDPQFTFSLSPIITAVTGLDVLTHAIESYWNVNSTIKSKKSAEQALSLVLTNLAKATKNPTINSRIAMSKAAYLAGKAINITKTTVCHAVSYPLTSYFNIPHGHAASLTLSSMLIFNNRVNRNDVVDKRGAKFVKQTTNDLAVLLGTTNVTSAKKRLNNLIKEIGLEIRLECLGVKGDKEINIILKHGFNSDRVKNNPRKLTKNQLEKILKNILR